MADYHRYRDRDAHRTQGINTAILAVTIIILIVGSYIWYKRDRLPDPEQMMPRTTEQTEPEQPRPDGAEEEPAGPKYPVLRQPALDAEAPDAGADAEADAGEEDESAADEEEGAADDEESVAAEEESQREPLQQLPPLEQSDEPLREELSRELKQPQLADWFVPESMIRHFVVTVDNLPREKLAWKYSFVEPAPGKFKVRDGEGEDSYYLDPANFGRYERYIGYIESIDIRQIINVYVHFYPLFQQAYEDLGYPDRYFNDRMVEVIDHLLTTPSVQPPIKLVRPKVFYKYADPELESLSAGQKLLIRSGPDNSARIKSWLQKLRARLTALSGAGL